MQLNQISSIKQQRAKRVGRGGKKGTFSGRGVKGQKARSGRKLRPEWRDILKHIPKKRGYQFTANNNERPLVLNLNKLNKAFKDGELVNAKSLVQKNLASKTSGRLPEIKILGDGEISKKLNFKGLKVSSGARAKIEKAGGTIA